MVCVMDAMIVTTIAPVMMTTKSNKDEKKTKRAEYKSKAKRREDDATFDEEFAAIYQHDPYAELSGITYTRPRAKGY